jgi:copper oxidase (laccase) domain-containing protein
MIELLRAGGIACISLGADDLPGGFDAREEFHVLEVCRLHGLPTPRQAVQVHGVGIDRGGVLVECDAFFLGPGECALVRHADCFPVVVADPLRGVAALAHCGWKGVVGGLAGLCAQALLDGGSRPVDLIAAIGPGIGPDSFEVGPDVQDRFPERHHAKTRWGTSSVDLPAAIAEQLAERGVASSTRFQIDTFVNHSWHSHRRDPAHSGRNATICIVHP